jgi:hypothetical protein
MTDKPDNLGFVLGDPQSGAIIIGKDTDVNRKREIQINSRSLAAIRLFDDGGFQIRSNLSGVENQEKDEIYSNGPKGLNITSTLGDINISAPWGEITLEARAIRIKSTGTDKEDLIRISSDSDVSITALDDIRIASDQLAIGAKSKAIFASGGSLNICGRGGVAITEPKTKLIPTSTKDFLDKLIGIVFPDLC